MCIKRAYKLIYIHENTVTKIIEELFKAKIAKTMNGVAKINVPLYII
jgi:uncharacterized protein YlbG (UPF0298 family)